MEGSGMASESTTIIPRDVAMRILANGGLVIDRWTKEVVWYDGERYRNSKGTTYDDLPNWKWLGHPEYPIDIFSIEYPVSLWGVADRMLTDSPPGMLVVTKESEPNHKFSIAPGWLESQRQKFREMSEVKAAPVDRRCEYTFIWAEDALNFIGDNIAHITEVSMPKSPLMKCNHRGQEVWRDTGAKLYRVTTNRPCNVNFPPDRVRVRECR
jgi:hypothetical protein